MWGYMVSVILEKGLMGLNNKLDNIRQRHKQHLLMLGRSIPVHCLCLLFGVKYETKQSYQTMFTANKV